MKKQSAENIPTSKQRLKTFGGKNMGKASGPHLQTCNSSYQSERGSVVTYNTLERDKTFREETADSKQWGGKRDGYWYARLE